VLVSGALSTAGRQTAVVQPARPPIIGIAHVVLQTSDLDKANRFYGELLGFSRLSLGNTNVSVFSVNERQQLIVSGGLPPDRDERLMTVGFTTTSLWDMRSFLKALGANPGVMTTDPIVRERVLDVIDPDGHHVRFVEWNGETPPPPPPQDRRISRRILHAGLTIRDVASADRFYKDLLGFSEIWRGGRTPDVTSWINMRVPDATEYLEYMLVMGERVDRRQLGTLHHVALVVPDMQEALLTVRSRTASDDPNHRATPQIGRNNRWQLNLYDPDGTRIELMEPWTVR
jgi:catechol 2,3-dioxygenase-like lactoylglutathione lyase family enzyme